MNIRLGLLLGLLLSGSGLRAQTAASLIAEGRALLAQRNLVTASVRFASAGALAPNNDEANALYGITRVLALPYQPAAQAFLDRLGFSQKNRSIYYWSASVPRTNGVPLGPADMSASEITAFIRTNAVPTLTAATANLAKISNTNFLLNISSNETTVAEVALDYGDILMLRAGMHFMEYLGYTLNTWNLDMQLSMLRSLDAHLLTPGELLDRYPSLFNFATTTDLATARAAFSNAADTYAQASWLIRTRPPGVTRLFNYDANVAGLENRFRRTIAQLRDSLAGPLKVNWRLFHTRVTSVDLDGQFDPVRPLRTWLPESYGQGFLAGTSKDPSFGGIFPEMKRGDVNDLLGDKFSLFPNFDPLVHSEGSTLSLRLNAKAGETYWIQESTDLTTWSNIQYVLSADGAVPLSKILSGGSGRRFYRAVEVPGAPNDNFMDSIEITGTNTTVRGSIFNATREQGEPSHVANEGETFDRTAWWHWIAPQSGWLEVFLSGGANGLAVYVGGNDMSTIRLLETGYQSASVPITAGQVYRLVTGSRYNPSDLSPQASSFSLSLNLATKPANDDFASRTILSGNKLEVSGDTLAATRETNERTHVLDPQPSLGTKTVWYEWTAPTTGRYSFWLDDYDHHGVIVYTGSSLISVAKAGGTAAVWDAVASQVYYLAVINTYEPSGHYALHLASTPSPVNDNFANRMQISGTDTTFAGDLSGATLESSKAEDYYRISGSVWWTWVAPSTGVVVLDTSGSDAYPSIYVHTGSSLSTLTNVSRYSPQGTAFSATSGTAYHIVAADSYSGQNRVVIRLKMLPPPLNDSFSNRTTLTGTNLTFSGNNLGATSESGEPNPDPSVDDTSIWWKWTAPSSGTVTISLLSYSFSPHLAISTGTSVGGLTLVTSDSFGNGNVSFWAQSGATYNIQVSGRYGGAGSVTFNFNLTPPPINDSFSNSTTLTGTNFTFSGNNVGATSESGEANVETNPNARVDDTSIWWQWTAPAFGSVTMSLVSSQMSPCLGIYTGTSVSALSKVASDSSGQGIIFFSTQPGVIYNIRVSGQYGGTGSVTFNFTYTPPPAIVEMALIPAGSFQMGDSFNEGNGNELPMHTVSVSAFYMDKYEVTKALWDEVSQWAKAQGYSIDSGSGKMANHPIHSVSWYDAVKWCNARSQKEGRVAAYYTDAALTQVYMTREVAPYVKWNAGYRLPTEAEWENAARGGTSGRRFPWTDADTITHNRANYYSDSGYAYDLSAKRGYDPTFNDGISPPTSPVGYFAPNGYGLYDMAGNIREWCWDWLGSYSSGSQTDPRGPASGSGRMSRGGFWGTSAFGCRSAIRNYDTPDSRFNGYGFRSVLPPGQQ